MNNANRKTAGQYGAKDLIAFERLSRHPDGRRVGDSSQAHVLCKGLAEADVVALLQKHARGPRIPFAIPCRKALVSAINVQT